MAKIDIYDLGKPTSGVWGYSSISDRINRYIDVHCMDEGDSYAEVAGSDEVRIFPREHASGISFFDKTIPRPGNGLSANWDLDRSTAPSLKINCKSNERPSDPRNRQTILESHSESQHIEENNIYQSGNDLISLENYGSICSLELLPAGAADNRAGSTRQI